MMFGFNSGDWRNVFGLGGVPGYMNLNQQLLGNLFPQKQGGYEYDPGFGSSTSLSDLLTQMRGQGGATGGTSSNYLGGDGFI